MGVEVRYGKLPLPSPSANRYLSQTGGLERAIDRFLQVAIRTDRVAFHDGEEPKENAQTNRHDCRTLGPRSPCLAL